MDNIHYEELRKKYDDLLKSYIEMKYRYNNLQKKINNEPENIKIVFKTRKNIDLKITKYNFEFSNISQYNRTQYIINNSISIYFDSKKKKINKNEFENSLSKQNNNFEILNKNHISKEKEIISSSFSNNKDSKIGNYQINNFELSNSNNEKNKIDNHDNNFEISYMKNEKNKIVNYEINNFELSYIKNDKKKKINSEISNFELLSSINEKILNHEINNFELSYINNEKNKIANYEINNFFEISYSKNEKLQFKNLQKSNFSFSFPNILIQEGILKDEKESEFDCVIEITRMSDLIKEGWKYYSNEDFKKYFEDTKMNYLVGIFGDKFTGKTFILNKLFKKNLIVKDKDLKPSLSFKIYNNNLIFLDSLGSNLPPNYFKEYLEHIDKDQDEYEKYKRKVENEISTKINELFIRNFVLELSHLCIYVVPYLTNSELERINLIKKNFIDKEIKINYDEKVIKTNFNDKVIIIHNIQSLKNFDDIENYGKILIRELNLEKHPIINTNSYYYVEKEIDHNGNESYLLHLILGNDNFPNMKKYNETIFNYLFTQIQCRIIRNEFNLKNKLKEYFKNFALQYFDLKEKTNNDEVSVFIDLRKSINIFKENYLTINNNILKYIIAPNMNLRFKNITLDFISGQSKDKNINKIHQYRIYSIAYELFIEFYPLGEVNIENIKEPKIIKHEKYQKIIIEGKFEKNNHKNDNKNNNLLYNKIISVDNIINYNSFYFSCFISKMEYILTGFKRKSSDKDGKLIFVFEILDEEIIEESLGNL